MSILDNTKKVSWGDLNTRQKIEVKKRWHKWESIWHPSNFEYYVSLAGMVVHRDPIRPKSMDLINKI